MKVPQRQAMSCAVTSALSPTPPVPEGRSLLPPRLRWPVFLLTRGLLRSDPVHRHRLLVQKHGLEEPRVGLGLSDPATHQELLVEVAEGVLVSRDASFCCSHLVNCVRAAIFLHSSFYLSLSFSRLGNIVCSRLHLFLCSCPCVTETKALVWQSPYSDVWCFRRAGVVPPSRGRSRSALLVTRDLGSGTACL